MCNQVVNLVAAALEEKGISTVVIQLLKEITKKMSPPRALYVPFNHGYPLNTPNEPEKQHHVIEAALNVLETANSAPIIVDYKTK